MMYRFLIQEGQLTHDPTEFLNQPRQWTTLPKYLNRDELDRLIAAPPVEKSTGIRDRAAGTPSGPSSWCGPAAPKLGRPRP